MEAERRRIAEALPAYDVDEEIGRGAWGVVYAGRHRHLDRRVAIKLLPGAFGADTELRTRFAGEARLIASLDHPHIVPVYDYVEGEGIYLIVMEHLPGGTLWRRFSEHGVAMDEAVAVILAACSALQYAHERNILHRDIKPDNLILTGTGTPKLTDFGIAKLLNSSRTALTAIGTVVGTPAYMAPEQAQGGELFPATDVYATAVMLYELLSASLPFPEVSDPVSQLYQHVHSPPRPLSESAPAVPAGLCDAVMRALAKDPGERPPSAETFGVALARAATAAWGVGWVRRSGITVMDRGEIAAAMQQSSPGVQGRSAPVTLITRGTGIGHADLPAAEPAEAELAEVVGLAAEPPSGPPAERPPSGPTPGGPSGPVVLPLLDRPVAAPPPRFRRAQLAGAGAVAVAAVLGAVLLLGGGGDGGGQLEAAGKVADRSTASSDGSGTTAPTASSTTTSLQPSPPTTQTPVAAAPSTTAPRATTTTAPPATTTTAPPATTTTVPAGRSVRIDAIRVIGGRYVVNYTASGFVPRIAEDPAQYHVHFFWNTIRPEQAGTNAAQFGATVGEWVLWDQPVFDAYSTADRPAAATQICAVVGTHHHAVDDPQKFHCLGLPA